MADPGTPFVYSYIVPAPPSSVLSALFPAMPQGGNYFDQCEVHNRGFGSMQVERKFVPVWAIVLAIIGALLFLIGLLFLLVRTTEILQITVYEDPNGSRVDVNGTSSKDVVSRIQSALQYMTQYGVPAGMAPLVSPFPIGTVPMQGPGNQPGTYQVPPPQAQAAPMSGVSCSSCGTPFVVGSAYCAQCGTPVTPPL